MPQSIGIGVSLKRNILANYASQIYVTLIGIVMVPMYLKYMGAEAYGLVGFFAMIQVWFGLLDMGLTLTLVRETSRLRVGAVDPLTYRHSVRALELIFICVGIVGGALMFFNSASIGSSWLNVQQLDMATVTTSLQLMAFAVAMRWMSGLYRGIVSGVEDFVWLGGFNAFIATWRFIGVIPLLVWLGGTPLVFFGFQFALGLIELFVLFLKAGRLLPELPNDKNFDWSLKIFFLSVRRTLTFSIGISFAALVWVMMTQVDKLLLSKLLSLADYGIFTLSVLAASGVSLFAGPLSNALLPRLARLHAQGDEAGLILLYKKMTRAVVVIVVPISLLLALFSEKILFVWTGNLVVAVKGGFVLSLYALGNAVLAAAAFPYYLQYAKGELRLHLIGTGLFLLAFIPSLLLLTQTYGVIGAGYAWLVANILYLLLWTPVVHKKFAKSQHWQWLVEDVVLPSRYSVFALLAFAVFMTKVDAWPIERIPLAASLFVTACVGVGISLFSQREFRGLVNNWWILTKS